MLSELRADISIRLLSNSDSDRAQSKGAVNAKGKEGQTPLRWGAEKGQKKDVAELLKKHREK